MKTSLFFIVLLVCLALFSCGGSDESPRNPTSPDTSDNPPSNSTNKQNLDARILADMADKIEGGTFGKISSIIIVRNEEVVVERYFLGFSKDKIQKIYSATKSITSAVIGIAIDQGLLSLEDELLDFFPEYATIENRHPWKDQITIGDVLKMSTGFEWQEGWLSPKPDFIKFVLDLPMVFEPGTNFRYNSGSILLLSAILQKKTGSFASSFGAEHLLTRIGIEFWDWDIIPLREEERYADTMGGLWLRPIDMANIGILFLNKGRHNGQQVVPEDWVEASTSTQISASEKLNYGYQWWRVTDNSGVAKALRVNDMFFAWGSGGQFIFVIPHLNMVVVATGSNWDTAGSQMFEVLSDYVFAAVLDQ